MLPALKEPGLVRSDELAPVFLSKMEVGVHSRKQECVVACFLQSPVRLNIHPGKC